MKKIFILLLTALILFSGCVGQKTVKNGDNVSVDYVGSLTDGKVFDTSNESVARENNLFDPEKSYKLFKFKVGKGAAIKGFDEGVIGMKIGETKTLTIPPEKGYGPYRPEMVQSYPILQEVPTKFPRIINISLDQFNGTFGADHKVGDIVTIPRTTINLTIKTVSENVTLSYNFKVGDLIPSSGAPWNETVIKVDEKNVSVKYSVKKNDTIQFQNVPWNTTIINITDEKMTMKHNAVADTQIQSMFGQPIRVHFNETSIIMDQNHELAGKTLIFKVTLKSIG